MARQRHSAKGVASLVFVFLLLLRAVTVSSSGVLKVFLDMPRFATRGSSVILECNHNVHSNDIYKVEWHKDNKRIAQYISGRHPPFTIYNIPEGYIDTSQATDKYIVIKNVGILTSGRYLCEVMLENPLYSRQSESKSLLVIEPQRKRPNITFSSSIYSNNDIFGASCSTDYAHPAPHVIWLVNGKKVDEVLTTKSSELFKEKNGLTLLSSTTNLSMPVSYFGLSTETKIYLTCLATIPAYVGPSGGYADTANVTVMVDVKLIEEPEPSTSTEIIVEEESSSAKCSIGYFWLVCSLFTAVYWNA